MPGVSDASTSPDDTTSWTDARLARLGHDMRTPLQAIIGFTGTLLMRLPGPLNEEQEHQLQLVAASAQQLLSLINQLPHSDSR
jgi:signal transduction histidine kinase